MDFLKSIFGGGVAGIEPAEAGEKLKSANPPFLLDVREPGEFKQGHIEGAKLIPLGDLARRLNELPKDREILCVCRSGARSGIAARQLEGAGFNTLNLRGGMIGWQQSGLPVKRGK